MKNTQISYDSGKIIRVILIMKTKQTNLGENVHCTIREVGGGWWWGGEARDSFGGRYVWEVEAD